MSHENVELVRTLYQSFNDGTGAESVPDLWHEDVGIEALRSALEPFFALKPRIEIEVTKVHQAGDLALTCSSWKLQGTDPNGEKVVMEGRGNEVVRRQKDGSWLIAIDNPLGHE